MHHAFVLASFDSFVIVEELAWLSQWYRPRSSLPWYSVALNLQRAVSTWWRGVEISMLMF